MRPKKSIKVKRLCKIKKFSSCFNKKRCCVKVTKCVGGFCKTSRRKCSWVGKGIKRYCRKKVTRITCELYADPHVHGFNNKYYEAQTEGDWVLYKGHHLSAHYRGKRVGGWVAAIKFGVRLFKYKIYSVGFNFDSLIINGKLKKIENGINKLSHRASIIKNGNKITFSTNNGEEVDFITFGTFFNVYVRSNFEKIGGICSQEFTRSKFFHHIHRGHIINITHKKCPKKNEICKSL